MNFSPKPNSALLIVGHGSTENPDSSTPYFDHAREIRKRNLFAEVHCCFWKEEPSMREALYTVGIHPSMTSLILQRTAEVAPGVPQEESTLFIVGHGTGLNKNSTKAIRDQVDLIKTLPQCHFADVIDTYMEEPPFIADWAKLSNTPNVVVVPFFIADGLHSYQDIPMMLGFEKEEGLAASQKDVFRNNPYSLQEKTLYYSAAIGTEPMMADVILDQISTFDDLHVTHA